MRDGTERQRGLLLATAVLILLFGSALEALPAERSSAARNPFRLSPQEAAQVSDLTRSALVERELDTGQDRLHLVSTRVVRDKEAEERGERGRFALATYYRYEGDLTIFARVDLARGEVVSVDTLTGVPTPLSAEEFEHAKKIALADPKIAAAISERDGGVEIEPLIVRTVSEDDPLFGHRAVRLLFKTPRGYLRRPIVVVDLTVERAIIEPPPAEESPAYPGTAEPKR